MAVNVKYVKEKLIQLIIIQEEKIMEFITFANEITNNLEGAKAKDYDVRLQNVQKNNGLVLTGVTIMDGESNISPTIYLNDYFNKYSNGEMTIEEVSDDIWHVYLSNRTSVPSNVLDNFRDWNKVKEHVIFKVINAAKNTAMLVNVPYIIFHDLAIIFQVLVSEEKFGNSTVQINNEHAKFWNVNKDELYKTAMENTPKLCKYSLNSMSDVLTYILDINDPTFEFCDSGIPMYVITNRARTNGAGAILYPELLKDFATAIHKDLFILPSSVHECILLPVFGDENIDELKSMVKDINETQVAPEEVLSDSVYYYSMEKQCIELL